MKYLIDTHVLLWIVNDPDKLSKNVRDIYLNEENEILVSIASIWEMAIKISFGKLKLASSLSEFVEEQIIGNKMQVFNLNLQSIYRLESLPYHHRDPFDRIIISQAICDDIPIITHDKEFCKYDISCIS